MKKHKLIVIHLLLIILSFIFINITKESFFSIKYSTCILILNISIMLLYFKKFKINVVSLSKYFIFLSILFSIIIFNIDYFLTAMMQTTSDMSLAMEILIIIINILLAPFVFAIKIIYTLGFIKYLGLIILSFLLVLYLISKQIIK